MSFRHTLLGLAAMLPLAAPAIAQPTQPAAPGMGPGIATPLRGAWFKGACATPEAMLYVTPRSLAEIDPQGAVRVQRFVALREAGGWSIATARGAEAPRTMLRLENNQLSTAEPGPKLRDDAIPGETPIRPWGRCPAVPMGIAVEHGEGLAALGALERLEEACGLPGKDMRGCIETIVSVADVSGDKLLSSAELARLIRGLAWVVAAQEDGSATTMGAAAGGGAIGGMLAARLMIENLDYDGDGKLSRLELGQDRVMLPDGSGAAAGTPLRTEGLGDGANLLRSLLGTVMGEE